MMTADHIRVQRFTTQLWQGLSPQEVSAFLEDVAEAFADLQERNTKLTIRVTELEREVHPSSAPDTSPEREPAAPAHLETLRTSMLREVEAMLRDAHAQAQTLVDGARAREAEMLREAEAAAARLRAEGEETIGAAAARAEAIVAAAREQEAQLRHEIERLTQSRLQLVDDVRATLERYHEWLASVDPRGRARGRGEAQGVGGNANGVGVTSESRAG